MKLAHFQLKEGQNYRSSMGREEYLVLTEDDTNLGMFESPGYRLANVVPVGSPREARLMPTDRILVTE